VEGKATGDQQPEEASIRPLRLTRHSHESYGAG
jgi:hypothetical protein